MHGSFFAILFCVEFMFLNDKEADFFLYSYIPRAWSAIVEMNGVRKLYNFDVFFQN